MSCESTDWKVLFSQSEEKILNSLASYLYFLAFFIGNLTNISPSNRKTLDVESQVITSLLLIKNIHILLLNRKCLFLEEGESDEYVFFKNNNMKQSLQEVEHTLNACHSIKKNTRNNVKGS